MGLQGFTRVCVFATVLALLLAVHDAYLRSSQQAAAACPAATGCEQQTGARTPGPAADRLAWQRQQHPRAALLLGVVVLGLAAIAWRRRHRPGQQLLLPLLALVLTLLQVASSIGVATQLPRVPLVVTGHLLAGLSAAALLWWLALRHGGLFTGYARPLLGIGRHAFAPWVLGGIVLVYLQAFLGGWLGSHDAARACADFPLCRGELLPVLDLHSALRVWHGSLAGAERVLIGDDARVTMHWLHRCGALVVLLYLGVLSIRLLRGAHDTRLKAAGGALGLVLSAQIGGGIALEQLGSPLAAALAHGAGAALLLLTLVSVYHVLRPAPSAI